MARPQVSPFDPSFPTKRDFSFRISHQLPQSLERLRTGALALSQPKAAGIILKGAAIDTLLAAYRRRFLSALPGIVNMRRENFQRADPRINRTLVLRFLKANQRYNEAKVLGDVKALTKAKTSMALARERVRTAVRPGRRSKHPLPRTGEFRRLALRVMDLVADVNEAHVFVTQAGVVLGIGDLAALEQIRTPSATEELTGVPTTSKRDVLWKHIEFGTGAMASDKSMQRSRYRLAGGGWWYGRKRLEALQLKGSQAANALGDPSRRIASSPEAARFYARANLIMTEVLFGTQ